MCAVHADTHSLSLTHRAHSGPPPPTKSLPINQASNLDVGMATAALREIGYATSQSNEHPERDVEWFQFLLRDTGATTKDETETKKRLFVFFGGGEGTWGKQGLILFLVCGVRVYVSVGTFLYRNKHTLTPSLSLLFFFFLQHRHHHHQQGPAPRNAPTRRSSWRCGSGSGRRTRSGARPRRGTPPR